MSASERRTAEIHAYHDGELSLLARWRVRRRLARDPAARRELESLASLGTLLREADAEAETPDLWEGIRERLPALDAARASHGGRAESERASAASWLGDWLPAPRWVGAAAAAAVLALALFVGLDTETDSDQTAVRWLDSGGRPLMVLQDDDEATIIWVPEGAPGELSGRRGRAFI